MLRMALMLLLASFAMASPTQVNLTVINVRLGFDVDTQIWQREREFSPKDGYSASALFRSTEESSKSIRIGISKVAYFPDEKKPRALRSREEIPKLFKAEGGIGNCSFGELQGYVQQGKDNSGEFIHFIMMEPAFGGIVYLLARNVSLQELEEILKTFKTKVQP